MMLSAAVAAQRVRTQKIVYLQLSVVALAFPLQEVDFLEELALVKLELSHDTAPLDAPELRLINQHIVFCSLVVRACM